MEICGGLKGNVYTIISCTKYLLFSSIKCLKKNTKETATKLNEGKTKNKAK
jgi:hypothetical protein